MWIAVLKRIGRGYLINDALGQEMMKARHTRRSDTFGYMILCEQTEFEQRPGGGQGEDEGLVCYGSLLPPRLPEEVHFTLIRAMPADQDHTQPGRA